jgi:predicted 3-demethylubiquinone-9 3-methyltransferase (glyoxalase superfamily)
MRLAQDKFGLSWQIIPSILGELLHDRDHVKSNRVMEAMLRMDKIDIALLQQAHEAR